MKEDADMVEIAREARRLREHEDGDVVLEELMDTFVGPVSDDWPVELRDALVRGEEFVCASCHLSLHRNLMSDERICISCSAVEREEVSA